MGQEGYLDHITQGSDLRDKQRVYSTGDITLKQHIPRSLLVVALELFPRKR